MNDLPETYGVVILAVAGAFAVGVLCGLFF